MKTLEHANELANVAVEILFSSGDPFNGTVSADKLRAEIRTATLKKLVIEDEDVLSEQEFQECLKAARLVEQ